MRNTTVTLILILLLSSGAQAAVRTFVATSGIDGAECSRAAPCRTFAAAINAVDDGGEVLVLDSGGYGPVSITKSVSIIAPASVHAAIAPTSGTALRVLAPAGGRVVLRGLYLNSQGGVSGIEFDSGRDLYVESCVISGFTAGRGIETGGGFGQLFVSATTVRRCDIAIQVGALSADDPNWTSIDDARLLDNAGGLYAQANSKVTVSRTIFSNNFIGVAAQGGDQAFERTDLNITDCVFANNHQAAIDTSTDQGSCVVTLSDSAIMGSVVKSINVGLGTTFQTRQNSTLGSGAAVTVSDLTPLSGI